MTRKEKNERKLKSIEIMETKKVDQWKQSEVFKNITSFEWIELKSTYPNLG